MKKTMNPRNLADGRVEILAEGPQAADFGRSRVVGWGDLGRSDGYRGGDEVWYPSVNHRKSGKNIGKLQENHRKSGKTIGKP